MHLVSAKKKGGLLGPLPPSWAVFPRRARRIVPHPPPKVTKTEVTKPRGHDSHPMNKHVLQMIPDRTSYEIERVQVICYEPCKASKHPPIRNERNPLQKSSRTRPSHVSHIANYQACHAFEHFEFEFAPPLLNAFNVLSAQRSTPMTPTQ